MTNRPCSQDKNIVLANTYEYRQPSAKKRAEAAAKSTDESVVSVDMTSRYLGLVVIPGEHIVKMQVELFASQMKGETIV